MATEKTKQREDDDIEAEIDQHIDDKSDDQPADPEVRDAKDGGAEVDVPHESRRERRARLHREQLEEQISGHLRPLREQNEMLARQLQGLTQILQQRQQEPPQPRRKDESGEVDELDPDIVHIKVQQKDIIGRMKTAPDQATVDALERKWHQLEQKSIDLRAEKIVAKKLADFKPPAQMSYHEQQLRSEFPDVFADPQAQEHAWALFTQAKTLAERKGERFDFQAGHRDALTRAAVAFGLRKQAIPAPSESQRQRFAAPGGNGSERRGGSTTRTLTPMERQAALIADDRDVPDSQKIADWVKKMEATGYFEGR